LALLILPRSLKGLRLHNFSSDVKHFAPVIQAFVPVFDCEDTCFFLRSVGGV
jgi:hypothetical protein